MSNAALTTVLTDSKSRGIDRLVLAVIADRADASGKAVVPELSGTMSPDTLRI
jgi:hypothetical protein